jgi:hypothetical protein
MRWIAVDDEVEQGMQHVVDVMLQQSRRGFELPAQARMGARRAVADGDDVVAADEDVGLAIGDAVALEMRGSRDDEELVAKDVDLRHLMRLERILDGEGMQAELLLQDAQLMLVGLDQADPGELAGGDAQRRDAVERGRTVTLAIAIDMGGDDAHGASMVGKARPFPGEILPRA